MRYKSHFPTNGSIRSRCRAVLLRRRSREKSRRGWRAKLVAQVDGESDRNLFRSHSEENAALKILCFERSGDAASLPPFGCSPARGRRARIIPRREAGYRSRRLIAGSFTNFCASSRLLTRRPQEAHREKMREIAAHRSAQRALSVASPKRKRSGSTRRGTGASQIHELVDWLKRPLSRSFRYATGKFIDFPHAGRTFPARAAFITAQQLMNVAGAYWRRSGRQSADAARLRRVFSFHQRRARGVRLHRLEEAKRRGDHRRLGTEARSFQRIQEEAGPGA